MEQVKNGDCKMQKKGYRQYGVIPTKSSKHTLRDCTENESYLTPYRQRIYNRYGKNLLLLEPQN